MSSVVDTIKANPTTLFSDSVFEHISEIEKLSDRFGYKNGKAIRKHLLKAMDEVRQNVTDHSIYVDAVDERTNYRKEANSLYFTSDNFVQKYSPDFYNEEFDVQDFLENYATAYYLHQVGCPTVEKINDSSEFNLSQQGVESCPVLNRYDDKIRALVSTGFQDGTLIAGETRNYLYFDLAHGFNDTLLRYQELPSLGNNYTSMAATFGYNYRLHNTFLPDFLAESGPYVEANFSRVHGDEGNLGSHRSLIDARGGLEVHVFDYSFVNFELGVGPAWNWLNFGRGVPLQKENSWNTIIQSTVGGELPLGPVASLRASLGYFYDFAIGGAIEKYHHSGIAVGLGMTSNKMIPQTPSQAERGNP